MHWKTNEPLVSVVIPSFNQGRYIEQTLLSIIRQSYPCIEIIVIDGNSIDETKTILTKYSEKLDYWVSEADKGQADAINKGWLVSHGKYLCWLNSDDILMEDAISTAVEKLENDSCVDFVYGDLFLIDHNGKCVGYNKYQDFDIKKMIRYAGWISQPGNLFRRKIYETMGGLDINLHFQMDLDYWFRVGLKYNFFHINKPLACFRIHPEAKSSSQINVAANDILIIYKKIFENKNLPSEIIKHRYEAWANAYLYSAKALFQANNYQESLKRAYYSFKYYPFIILNFEYLNLLCKLINNKLPPALSKIFSRTKKFLIRNKIIHKQKNIFMIDDYKILIHE